MAEKQAERVIIPVVENVLVLWHVPPGETADDWSFVAICRDHASVERLIRHRAEQGIRGGYVAEQCPVV